jgi:hypothetical protein
MEQKLFLSNKTALFFLILCLLGCVSLKNKYDLKETAVIYYLPATLFVNVQLREDLKNHRLAKTILSTDKVFIDSVSLLLNEIICDENLYYPGFFSAMIIIELKNMPLIFINRAGNVMYEGRFYKISLPRFKEFIDKKYPAIWYFPQFSPEEINENRRLLGIDTLPTNDSQTE